MAFEVSEGKYRDAQSDLTDDSLIHYDREIELRQDFHVKYKQRWEERGHENGIHKGILEQISLKKGLMERLERDIASCEYLN